MDTQEHINVCMPYISEFLCSKLKGLLRKNERGSRLKPKNLRR